MIIPGATKVLQWNHWLLGFIGLWPFDLNNSKFIFFFAYAMVHTFLQYGDLIEHISDLNHVVANLTETIIINMLIFKMSIYRINTRQLRELIQNIEKDFSTELYNTADEMTIFLKYNSLSRTIVQCFSIMCLISPILFYIHPLLSHLLAYNDSMGNSSIAFVFPIHFRLFFNLTEERTYYIIYACEILLVPTCTCGYNGPICLMITLVLHTCGQISILASQVKSMIHDPKAVHQQLKQIVIKHRRVISLVANLQSAYSAILLPEVSGMTFVICLGSYNVITTSAVTDSSKFLKFLFYILTLTFQLFSLCYIGECLITESTNLYNAFCNYEWYNVSPDHAKLLVMCLLRSQRPLTLTTGKFFTFSLESFRIKTCGAKLIVKVNSNLIST
uniref:Odorant receptor n=1 Tax=Cephus cinctus TaxID=211228 RepID=A0A1W6L1A7_CEPCN|nr:odorant receptor 23 [Cephus cinctus]